MFVQDSGMMTMTENDELTVGQQCHATSMARIHCVGGGPLPADQESDIHGISLVVYVGPGIGPVA